jgi:hypothetical protein
VTVLKERRAKLDARLGNDKGRLLIREGRAIDNPLARSYLHAATGRNRTVFGALRLPFPSPRLS